MNRFSSILIVSDLHRVDSVALRRAIALAKSNQASVTIVGVVAPIAPAMSKSVAAVPVDELMAIAVGDAREHLDRAVAVGKSSGVDIVPKVLVGKAFIEIIRQVLRGGHDLLVKDVEPRSGLERVLFRSADMHLMRKCPCPVWITKADEQPRYGSIVAAIDYDPQEPATDPLNRQIIEMAVALALAESSELYIVHAWQLEHESYLRSPRTRLSSAEVDGMVSDEEMKRRRWLDQCLVACGRKSDRDAVDYVAPKLLLLKGEARRVVPGMARELNAGLMVLGTVARTGIDGFIIGNTAEDILSRLDCSVLTVKPAGFVSPVTGAG